jgi:predicted  nucleic acid-binding Zn-ribbon protein
MAADELPDLDELSLELVRLERREPELARQLERAEQRAGAFPSSFGMREVRRLKLELQAIRDRIDGLDAMLLPLRRVRDRN